MLLKRKVFSEKIQYISTNQFFFLVAIQKKTMESSDFDPSLMSTESSVGKPESSHQMLGVHIGAALVALGLVEGQCRKVLPT